MAATETKMREFSQTRDDVVAVIGCARISRPHPPMEVPFIDQLRALPSHVECDVAEDVFHRDSMALG
jgi:hypothetical protein